MRKLTEYTTVQLQRMLDKGHLDPEEQRKIQVLLDVRSAKAKRNKREGDALGNRNGFDIERASRSLNQSLRSDVNGFPAGAGGAEQYLGGSLEEFAGDDADDDGDLGDLAGLPGIYGHDHSEDRGSDPGQPKPGTATNDGATAAWRLQRREQDRESAEPDDDQEVRRRDNQVKKPSRPELNFSPIAKTVTGAISTVTSKIPTISVLDADTLSKKEANDEGVLEELTDNWMQIRKWIDEIITAISADKTVAEIWSARDRESVQMWCKALMHRSQHSRFSAGMVRVSLNFTEEIIFFVMPVQDAWETFKFAQEHGISLTHSKKKERREARNAQPITPNYANPAFVAGQNPPIGRKP